MGYHGFSVYTGRMMRNVCTLAVFLLLQTSAAMAFQATQNLGVSVLVPNPVLVSATPMNFGSSFAGMPASHATAVISVTMANTQAYTITVDAGLHAATEHRMSNGAGRFLIYYLYSDASRTQLWGDAGFAGNYAAGSALAAVGTGSNQNFTIYGTTQATLSSQPSGAYNDTVVVTINY